MIALLGWMALAVAAPTVVESDPTALARVAADVLRWRAAHPTEVGGGADPTATLEWIVQLAAEDEGKPQQRLLDADWLATHGVLTPWLPDTAAAAARHIDLPSDKIRLTKYLAWAMEGVPTRDDAHPCALYAIPLDEQALSAETAAMRPDLTRFRYTRRQVLDGVFEPGGAAAGKALPLAYLSRSAIHEALMQGTVVVTFSDGTTHTLNVHRNNGFPWNPALARDPERQDRMWYFREVDGLRGVGMDDKIRVEPQVTVAGDIATWGVGTVFALSWTEREINHVRLVILADSGGAFDDNHFQLDWLVGTFGDRAAFDAAAAATPDRVAAATWRGP